MEDQEQTLSSTSIPNELREGQKTDHALTAAQTPSQTEDQSTRPNAANKTEPSATDRLLDFRDVVLRFFANASNDTLGACAVGLCASTYLVLGRVGLVLIGAVGGVVLHATWEGSSHTNEGEEGRAEAARKRKELGLEVAQRALRWRDTQRGDIEEAGAGDEAGSPGRIDYTDFRPATRKALDDFTDAVIRDYVKWWYSPIIPAEEVFPSSCRHVLSNFIVTFSNRISKKRTADPFLDFIANSTSIIIVFLDELSSALRASPNQNIEDAIKTYLQYQPQSNLANVLSTEQQRRKLSLVAEDILQNFLDSKTYSFSPAKVFLREVLTNLILESTINTCSKADWINSWIVYLLEDGEPEIMNAIDAGVETMGKNMQKAQQDGKTSNNKIHQRRMSRAEDAMQEAMREAQKLNAMIAEDDARRKQSETSIDSEEFASSVNTDTEIPTPTSSDSGRNRTITSYDDSIVFDSEGNNIPSGTSSPARVTSPVRSTPAQFTNFDQLRAPAVPTALRTSESISVPTETAPVIPIALQDATITILDITSDNDKAILRQKPNDDYFVQVEPASSRFPGWMVSRKYADFEKLHETLRRIAAISGIPEFNQQNPNIPPWKNIARGVLIQNLEIYLKQGLRFERLAECEAMKKFLQKDTGLEKGPQNKNVLLQGAAALDNVGKGFINVLGQGGKGIAGGGKAVLGGVQGVFGAVTTGVAGPKRSSVAPLSRTGTSTSQTLPRSATSGSQRESQDLSRSSMDVEDRAGSASGSSRPSFDQPRLSTTSTTGHRSQDSLSFPPPPSEITDDYVPVARADTQTISSHVETSQPPTPTIPTETTPISSPAKPPITRNISTASLELPVVNTQPSISPKLVPHSSSKKDAPITEEETRMTVDLLFAIITSTYSLSSAWTIRLSLLSAAKTFLLRPNNPQLDSIRSLLQESLISSNTSDSAIASHIQKLRENTLPTEEELAKWPKPLTAEEKERLRVKARKLLVERGMPQALTSVMGQAASGEAMGKVFDCLQVQEVARGLMFGLLLQGARAVMQ